MDHESVARSSASVQFTYQLSCPPILSFLQHTLTSSGFSALCLWFDLRNGLGFSSSSVPRLPEATARQPLVFRVLQFTKKHFSQLCFPSDKQRGLILSSNRGNSFSEIKHLKVASAEVMSVEHLP